MRNLKQTFIITLLLLFTNFCFAQKPSIDSLIVEIDSQVILKMSIYNYFDLEKDVGDDLKRLQKILKVNQDVPNNLPYTITYKPNEKLTIKTEEKAERLIWEKGEYKSYKFDNTCYVFSNKYHLTIDFNEYEELISENLIVISQQSLVYLTRSKNFGNYVRIRSIPRFSGFPGYFNHGILAYDFPNGYCTLLDRRFCWRIA